MGSLFSNLSNSAEHEETSESSGLSDQQIQMIRSSWEKVLPKKKHHGELLFHKLFEIAPQVKDLFPFGNDMTNPSLTAHALNVMNAVDLAVQNLDNPDVLISTLQELGRAHAMFELTNQDFGYVGQALLSVLEQGLGESFTPKLKAAWSDAYTIISDVMMGAITDYNANKA